MTANLTSVPGCGAHLAPADQASVDHVVGVVRRLRPRLHRSVVSTFGWDALALPDRPTIDDVHLILDCIERGGER